MTQLDIEWHGDVVARLSWPNNPAARAAGEAFAQAVARVAPGLTWRWVDGSLASSSGSLRLEGLAIDASPPEATDGPGAVPHADRNPSRVMQPQAGDSVRRVLDALQDPIICRDTEGRIIECNRAALQLGGFRREEVLGRTYRDLLSAEYAAHVERLDRQTISSRSTIRSREYMPDFDMELDVIRSPLFDEQGAVVGVTSRPHHGRGGGIGGGRRASAVVRRRRTANSRTGRSCHRSRPCDRRESRA